MSSPGPGRPKGTSEPYIKDPRLAAELRRLRAAANKTGVELAEMLGWSPSKVSRTEQCVVGVTRSELAEWLRALNVQTERGQAIFALAATVAAARGSFPGEHFGPGAVAGSVCDWSPVMVPWLLQTPSYTRALLESRQQVARLSPGQVNEFCDAVAAWQARLKDGMTVRALIGEPALYQLVGSERVMRAQLSLLDRPDAPGVEARVLPDECGSPAGYSAFTYFEYAAVAGVSAAPVVLTYQLGTMADTSDDQVAWAHKIAFDVLWGFAETPGPAVKQALSEAWGVA